MKSLRARCFLAAVAVAVTGCVNPFDPTADIKLERFFANGGLITVVVQSTAISNAETPGITLQTTEAVFSNYSTVGGEITSYSVVYRQLTAQPSPVDLPPGSPIPSLGGAAGRRFYTLVHFQGLRDNTDPKEFNTFNMLPRIITNELLQYIGGNPAYSNGIGSSAIGGGIDCEVIFFGQDHNGHDIKVSGVLHVQVD